MVQLKYNEKVSKFNSETQYAEDLQRIGNLIFNKHGNKKEQDAWLRIKDYLKRLESEMQ